MSVVRPYPNVRQGGRRYEAFLPVGGRQRYLGSFDSAEKAYAAVLYAQADHLEQRVFAYRNLAQALSGSCPGCGLGTEFSEDGTHVLCDHCGFASETRINHRSEPRH